MKLSKKHLAFLAFAVPIAVVYHSIYLQGAFQHGHLTLSIGGDKLRPNEEVRLFIAIDPNTDLDDIVYFPANLRIRNDGDKPLDNALLSLAYDKRSQYTAIDPSAFMAYHGAQLPGDSTHDYNSADDADFSNFGLKALNVKQSYTFKDGAQFYKDTSLSSFFEMALLRSDVKVSLQANDVQRTEYQISYRGVRANSCEESILRYKNEYAKYTVIKKREEMPFAVYAWHLLTGPRRSNDYLICPKYQSLIVDGKRVWIPAGDSKDVLRIEFKPYLWSLLFDTANNGSKTE